MIGNYIVGLVLHELAMPAPDFDPTDPIVALLESLLTEDPQRAELPRDDHQEVAMNTEDVWRAIDDQRRRLVALLEGLSQGEWQRPSLCQGWTVRDVAAHVALQNTTWSGAAERRSGSPSGRAA